MSTLQLIGGGFATVLTPTGIFLMLIGVAVGIVFGALPGLSATIAIALFLPVTYAMTSSNAMTLLMALFIGAISGGLISAILLPCVFVLCTIGAYALKNNMSQVFACLIFGVLGFAFKKLEIPSTPFILGFILGPLAEVNYRRGMIRTKGSVAPFLTSPISAIFLAIAIAVLVLYATKPLRQKRKAAKAAK